MQHVDTINFSVTGYYESDFNTSEVRITSTMNAKKPGRFTLAAGDTGLSPDEMLAGYKGQGAIEHGFRFLKDKLFRVSEIYPKRIRVSRHSPCSWYSACSSMQ